MTVEANELHEALGGLWGSRDPDEAVLEIARRGVKGEPNLLIDGKLVESASGRRFENINPTTEESMGTTADADEHDVERAIAAARRSFDETDWSTNHEFRRRCLEQLHAGLVRMADEIRATAVCEIGVGIRTTYGFHSDFAIDAFPYWAEVATNYEYEQALPDAPWAEGTRRIVRREPVGVVAAITPWNYPLYTMMTKVAPALAAGDTVILKPAPQTPWHATLLAKIVAEETDIPPGVLNVVATSDNSTAELLTTDGRVDMVHFTGSTAVGKRLMRNAAERLAKVSFELGGKSANIVLDDAPIESLIPIAAGVVCMNSGQGCVLPTRLLVPRARYEECIELAQDAYGKIPYGDPTEPHVIQGPQISEQQRERILGYVEKGKAEGATLLAGGGWPAHLERGYFVEPTLFADVDPDSTIAQEEIFGPVLSMIPYDNEEDAISIANNSRYGLAGAIWSESEERALRVARQIRTGALSVNGGFFYARDLPLGGYKQSGLGRESGVEGFEEFLETKALAVATG